MRCLFKGLCNTASSKGRAGAIDQSHAAQDLKTDSTDSQPKSAEKCCELVREQSLSILRKNSGKAAATSCMTAPKEDGPPAGGDQLKNHEIHRELACADSVASAFIGLAAP